MTQDQLAATLFHSLRDKIMTLPDDVTVYPAHGAGSACGKNMSKRQPLVTRKRPIMLSRYDREEFIKEDRWFIASPPILE
jgi:glyoxylase-like metal-dependent hydrolase (beta-lactamase superfamily II)